MKYVIEDTTLNAIGDAVRAKGNTEDKILVSNLATAINNLPTGGGDSGIPEEAFTITGDCEKRFANDGWNWFVEGYGDKVITKDITKATSMFSNSESLKEIKFEINIDNTIAGDMGNMFMGCELLKELPKVNNARPNSLGYFFQGCFSIREMPEDWCDTWTWTDFNASAYGSCGSFFATCYSLRRISTNFLKNFWTSATSPYSTIYSYMFNYCYVLDEIKGLKVLDQAFSSNMFSSTFNTTGRVKDITFETNEDGTPKVAQWKNQTIDLTRYVGCHKSYATNYNSGITADKEVKDDATYQALKDDPDWFTGDVNYSRYNRTSAVNTINSLPDCSATGTNTINFKGASGALTDGGAINTLTEEEIAVAAAKGWTVTLS